MGTTAYKVKAETLPHEYIASDCSRREAALQQGIDMGSADTNELDDDYSPLQKFINTHQTDNIKGASNGLPFQSVLQEQKPFGVHFESIKLLKPQGASDDCKKKSTIPRSKIRRPPRCSIDCSNVTQFKTTIKNFVVTEQNIGDSFGRI